MGREEVARRLAGDVCLVVRWCGSWFCRGGGGGGVVHR